MIGCILRVWVHRPYLTSLAANDSENPCQLGRREKAPFQCVECSVAEKKKKEDVIEVAKSGRAKCRGCGNKVEKGALRFGLVDFGFSESGSHRWYHLRCAQQKADARLQATRAKAPAEHLEAIDAELGGASQEPKTENKGAVRALSKDEWPLWLTKAKAPKRKIPSWVRSSTPPLTLDGKSLESEACIRLVGAMMKDKAGKPDKVLTEFRGWLEPSSYRNFAWTLFSNWAHADAHMVQSWVVRQVAQVVDDDMAAPLGEVIEVLYKKKKREAVREALSALCDHGSPTALQVVQRLAQRYKYRGHDNLPLALLGATARKRGVTLGTLEDMSVPSCGLDARGTRRFSYGPRTFRLEVDGEMRLSVVAEDDGTRLPRLPRSRTTDEEEKVRQAQTDFARLKRDIEAMLPVQCRRLEGALAKGRRWTLSGWTENVRRHPLMQIIARRLVWALYDGEARLRTFRLDDQDELSDENDDVCSLDGGEHIRLGHPADMVAEEREAWSTVFADYEIMQPFAQLARPAFSLSDAERMSTSLAAFSHEATELGPLHGRFNRADWVKGAVNDVVLIRTFHKEFAGDVWATAHLEPGFHPAGFDDGPQTVTHVSFRVPGSRTAALREVPAAALSEVIYDMNQVAG